MVWRLDRLGRVLPHLLQTVEDLAARGIGFKSLTEAIDTTTSGGKLIFSIFGTLATGDSIRKGQPLCLIGDSGTGKSHLLIGLWAAAAEACYCVKYVLATRLVPPNGRRRIPSRSRRTSPSRAGRKRLQTRGFVRRS